MKNANILNEIMGNELVKALLEQASPEEREEGMKMIKDITSTVQKQVSEMMPAMKEAKAEMPSAFPARPCRAIS